VFRLSIMGNPSSLTVKHANPPLGATGNPPFESVARILTNVKPTTPLNRQACPDVVILFKGYQYSRPC